MSTAVQIVVTQTLLSGNGLKDKIKNQLDSIMPDWGLRVLFSTTHVSDGLEHRLDPANLPDSTLRVFIGLGHRLAQSVEAISKLFLTHPTNE